MRVCENVENTQQLQQTTAQLRDEQQRRKQLQTQLNELQETNKDLAATNDAVETVLIIIAVIIINT